MSGQHKQVLERLPLGLYRSSKDGKLIYANDVLYEMLGYSSSKNLHTADLKDLYVDFREWEKLVSMVDRSKVVFDFEIQMKRFDGDVIWVKNTTQKIQDRKGEFLYYEGFVIDITQWKKVELERRLYVQLTDTILETLPLGLAVLDQRKRFVRLNPLFSSFFNLEPETILNSKLDTVLEKHFQIKREILNAIDDIIRDGGEEKFRGVHFKSGRDDRYWNIHLKGFPYWINSRQTYSGNWVLIIIEDVTLTTALQQQLNHSARLESIGLLAGGIAHDFNNILTGIIGFAELLLNDVPPETTWVADIEQIYQLSRRGADLTSQLLAFSRKSPLQPTVVSTNRLILDSQNLFQRLIGEHIEIEINLGSEKGMVYADYAQLEQVLINLLINARDAMPDGGKVTFETQDVFLDEAYIRKHANVTPGPYVMIAVSDTGCGIPKDIIDRIFDPFFTTKPQGKGTGLGLASSIGIIKQHGGEMWVYSEPNQGTTFKIYLPAYTKNNHNNHVQQITDSKPDKCCLDGKILLVEDEPMILRMAARVLRRKGYRVEPVDTPLRAEEIFKSNPDVFDLLITDIVMPGMSGQHLFKRLSAIKPDLKVIFMSGYTDRIAHENGFIKTRQTYLQKPFTQHALLMKIKTLLEEQG